MLVKQDEKHFENVHISCKSKWCKSQLPFSTSNLMLN